MTCMFTDVRMLTLGMFPSDRRSAMGRGLSTFGPTMPNARALSRAKSVIIQTFSAPDHAFYNSASANTRRRLSTTGKLITRFHQSSENRRIEGLILSDSRHGAKKVRACRLTREFKISLPETVRFYDADVDDDGILILDLRTARAPKSVRNHWVRKRTDAEESPVYNLRP